MILLMIYSIAGLLYWLLMARAAVRLPSVPTLRASASVRERRPSLTVIVPACNEAAELEPAARTLLAQNYPELELIFVNDRSTDATGRIIDELARGDSRVVAVHIEALPERWLGKVHALHTGLQRASGQIVLFTDADVHFAKDTLAQAVDYFLDNELDHLAGFPRLRPSGVWLGAMLAAFLRQFVAVMRPWKVADCRSRAFIGIGAFNMVRKQAFLDAGGFEWLRMEVGDDVGVGLMMKRAGARCGAAEMSEQLSLHWHRTVASAVRGSEKGWSSVCRFSITATLILGYVNTALELAPLGVLFLLWPATRTAGWAGLPMLGAYVFACVHIARWMHQPVSAHLLSILTAPVNLMVMVRTAVLGRLRGGALWRGTFYPTQALKDGMRLRLTR